MLNLDVNVLFRIPVPVNLRSKDLKGEISKAINTVTLPLNHHGTCSMVQIGSTNMEPLSLAANLVHVNAVLNKRYPGGWKNIRAQHIKTETSMAVPIYANTRKCPYGFFSNKFDDSSI